jgi:hypothetical protein
MDLETAALHNHSKVMKPRGILWKARRNWDKALAQSKTKHLAARRKRGASSESLAFVLRYIKRK